jgi:predicted transcriptional regulator
METAFSLPDDLFSAADALADRMGMSRSDLFATAVAEFVARNRATGVTERLNEVHAVEPSGLDADVRQAQQSSLGSERW